VFRPKVLLLWKQYAIQPKCADFMTSHPHMNESCDVAIANVTYSLRKISCLTLFASWFGYELICYSKSALNVLGDVFAHHQEQLTVFTISGSVHPSCCRLVSRMGRQPAATLVNTTSYCKNSQVLLMMGENVAPNIYSRLGIIN